MTISRNRLLPAVFCASIASLLALGTASAAHAGADTPYATIQIKNNFSSSLADAPQYFGQSIADDQVWLYLLADPNHLTYTDATTSLPKTFSLNQYVQLSQIKDGILRASQGSSHGVMYAVIHNGQPAAAPVPVPTCTAHFSDLAYAMFEWDFHVPTYENVDISNADQFSFTSRFTVTNSSGIVGRTGFKGSASSQLILEDLKKKYGGTGICEYPGGANFPGNYPLPTGCSLPTGNDTVPYTCNGLPADYLTRSCEQSGKMSQQITVTTNIAAVDTANAYRWVGSSKSQTSTIPGTYVNVFQGFGKSYETYLTALFNSTQNASGYYVDYSGGWIPTPDSPYKGVSYIFKVTQGAHGIGHGYEISDIRINTKQSGDSTSHLSKVNRQLGETFPGTLNILANGEPILNTPTSGCPIGPSNAAMNNYGNWTDATLVSGAATFGCLGSFTDGPVIKPSSNFNDPYGYTQDLIALIQGQSSAMINFGLITTDWNPQNNEPGTNFLFADANQGNWQTDHLFRAGPGNEDIWTKTLWTYQDLSLIPNSTSVYCKPLYLNTYGDRLSQMSPGQVIKLNDTILWELGVPTVISSTACRADFQHSGSVDGADLSTLLNAWGQCSGTCVADLNNDNAVDGADLAILLNAWGPCPV